MKAANHTGFCSGHKGFKRKSVGGDGGGMFAGGTTSVGLGAAGFGNMVFGSSGGSGSGGGGSDRAPPRKRATTKRRSAVNIKDDGAFVHLHACLCGVLTAGGFECQCMHCPVRQCSCCTLHNYNHV